MELKEQIKGELLKQKEEALKKQKEANSKLKEITLYTVPNVDISKNYKKHYELKGIKFKEKSLQENKHIQEITGNPGHPVIVVNGNYLVQGRDFHTPPQSIGVLRHYADPDYVSPSLEQKTFESLKNLQSNMGKLFQNLNRQLQPIVKIMNELQEEEVNKPTNEKKNN